MNFNPAMLMQLMRAKSAFDANHPKLKQYFAAVKSKGIKEGAVIELKITNPGEEPMKANIKVKAEDIELLSQMAEMMK